MSRSLWLILLLLLSIFAGFARVATSAPLPSYNFSRIEWRPLPTVGYDRAAHQRDEFSEAWSEGIYLYHYENLLSDQTQVRNSSTAPKIFRVYHQTAAAESAPQTIGQIIGDAHPDSMIHLTTASQAELANGGLDAGSIFVRLGDVSEMTVPEYQASVVGRAAAGYTSGVQGFVLSEPGAAQFVPWYESGAAGVAEHASVGPISPTNYIPLPGKP